MATTTQRETVVGIFRTVDAARDAIQALKDAGFSAGDISLLAADKQDTRDLARETGTHAGEGAATGLVAGGILGGLGGWLVGIGALAIPGIGPFIAAGAIGAAITGAAVGAGVGAIAGALIGMGIPREEADWYEQQVKGGGTLVAVKAPGRYDEAQGILRRNGAYDIQDREGALAGGAATAGSAATMQGASATARAGAAPTGKTAGQSLHLHEEQLRADKERVQTGEVRVGKQVVEEEKTLEVPVTREQVYVERRPGDQRPDDHSFDERAGETIRVPVSEERVDVEKVPVETEEVIVGKRAVEETKRFTETAKREEAKIEAPKDVFVQGAGAMASAPSAQAGRWEDAMPSYRTRWQQRYGSSGGRWEDVEPSYQYGWQMANDPRYRGRSWAQVEPDLRRDWGARYPDKPWDRAGQAIRDAWDNVTSRA